MCGITGYYSPNTYGQKTNRIVEMTELIKHRGPDDEGYVFIDTHDNIFTDASGSDSPEIIKERLKEIKLLGNINHNLAFGHRRYAIIDLSPGGHQPFWNDDHSVCVSFNGEIYNYIELRQELEKNGHKFITSSDTEVLIKSYEEWGDNCFEKFNGQWALSLYDTNKHKLLLSRDRIGKGPLYYTIRNNTLYWSSEIKSLLHICGIDSFTINKQAIHDFINYSLRDLDNSTFYNEILTLPAATYVIVDNNLKFEEHIYWTIPKERLKTSDISLDDAKQQLRNLLIDALNIRLRSDIPVGFALSGGMDSSSLLALYTHVLKKHTISFTVKFTEKGTNEEFFARMAAERCGNLVDYRVVEPAFGDFWKDADEYIWLLEEPFHSPNVHIEQLIQKKLKSEGFGVMINGNGGDELLAGYEYLYFPLYLDYLLYNNKFSFIKELFSFIGKDIKAFSRTVYAIVSLSSTVKNYAKQFMQEENFLQNIDSVKKRELPNTFNELMIGNMGQWLMNYWLRVGNKSYFGIPLETRSPFLDYRLAEFAFRLPPEYLIHNGWHKYILRKTVEDLLPKEVIWRKAKMGFPFPYGTWLKSSRHIIENNLNGINCPYVNIKNLFDNYDSMADDNPVLLWRYISLLLWWKRIVLKQNIVS